MWEEQNAKEHQDRDDVQHRSATSPALLLLRIINVVHRGLTVCMDWNGAAFTLMPLLWGALETGWNTCVWVAAGKAVEGGGCSEDNDKVCEEERDSLSAWWNPLEQSEVVFESLVHLDRGVDVFCRGSRVGRVSALVHGGRSRGNDRNLRARRAMTSVRHSEGQQQIKKTKKKNNTSVVASGGGPTCVGSGWTGTEAGCDSRDSGWTVKNVSD